MTAITAALALAGCGGSSETPTGADPVRSASFIPAGSLGYVEATTDVTSAQWQTAFDLAKRFPGFDELLKNAFTKMTAADVDFDTDVRPLLGDGIAMGIVTIPVEMLGNGSPKAPPPMVIAIDLADGSDDKALQLLRREPTDLTKVKTVDGVDIYRAASGDAWVALTDGTLVISPTEDALLQGLAAHSSGSNLAASPKLRSVLGALPDETVAQVYVDTGAATELVRQSAPPEVKAQVEPYGYGENSALGVSVTAEQSGLRLKGIEVGERRKVSQTSFTPELTSRVPANAVGFASATNIAKAVAEALEFLDDDAQQQVQAARGALSLADVTPADLMNLFGGEALVTLLGVNASDIPQVGILATPPNTADAAAFLDRAGTAISTLSNGQIGPPKPLQIAPGVTGWTADITGKDAAIVAGVDGDTVLAGLGEAVVRSLIAPPASIANDPVFRAATDRMPAQVEMLAWVNGERLLPILDRLGTFDDSPPKLRPNLTPLRNAAVWTTDGGDAFEAFVTIE